jgi:hypothetical protein
MNVKKRKKRKGEAKARSKRARFKAMSDDEVSVPLKYETVRKLRMLQFLFIPSLSLDDTINSLIDLVTGDVDEGPEDWQTLDA